LTGAASRPAAPADPALLVAEARRELARLPAALAAVIGGLDRETARTRPAELEWSPVEIVCHLRDEEAEDFRARIEHLLAGHRALSRIHPERWPAERGYIDADLVAAQAELERRRAASLEYLASIDPDALSASVTLGSLGDLSGLDLLAAWVAHDRLHLAQLAATLANQIGRASCRERV